MDFIIRFKSKFGPICQCHWIKYVLSIFYELRMEELLDKNNWSVQTSKVETLKLDTPISLDSSKKDMEEKVRFKLEQKNK